MHQRVFLLFLLLCFVARPVKADDGHSGGTTGTSSSRAQTTCDADRSSSGCDDACKPPVWSFAADALWLQRTAGNGAQLGRTFNVATGDTVDQLSSSDADYSMQAGTRFRVLYHSDEVTTWEAVYFGMQTWNGGNSVTPDLTGAGTLADSPYTQTDKLVGGFDESLAFHSTSRLHNVEINCRQDFASNDVAAIHWLAGVRMSNGTNRSLCTDSIPCRRDRRNRHHMPQPTDRSADRCRPATALGSLAIVRKREGRPDGQRLPATPLELELQRDTARGVPGHHANRRRKPRRLRGMRHRLLVSGHLSADSHLDARGGYQLLYLGGLAREGATGRFRQ